MRRAAAQSGFTLLEAALAIGLGLGLLAAMLGFYWQVRQVRGAARDQAALVGERRLIMEQMTGELRAAVGREFGLEGGADGLRFTTTGLPGPVVWIEQGLTETPLVPEQDLRIVGYRLRVNYEDLHNPVIEGVERTCQKILRPAVEEEGIQIRSDLLAERFKFLYLRYWDGSAWVASWGGGDLPAAVEVTLGREPLPESTEPWEYPYETFRRVVFVPAGRRPPEGTIVRGLGTGGGP